MEGGRGGEKDGERGEGGKKREFKKIEEEVTRMTFV